MPGIHIHAPVPLPLEMIVTSYHSTKDTRNKGLLERGWVLLVRKSKQVDVFRIKPTVTLCWARASTMGEWWQLLFVTELYPSQGKMIRSRTFYSSFVFQRFSTLNSDGNALVHSFIPNTHTRNTNNKISIFLAKFFFIDFGRPLMSIFAEMFARILCKFTSKCSNWTCFPKVEFLIR